MAPRPRLRHRRRRRRRRKPEEKIPRSILRYIIHSVYITIIVGCTAYVSVWLETGFRSYHHHNTKSDDRFG